MEAAFRNGKRKRRGSRSALIGGGVAAAMAGLIAPLLGTPTASAAPSVAPAAPSSVVPSAAPAVRNPAQYVDPLIGSADGGNTYPGANLPFGMIVGGAGTNSSSNR